MIVISHSNDVLAGSFHYPVHIGCVCKLNALLDWNNLQESLQFPRRWWAIGGMLGRVETIRTLPGILLTHCGSLVGLLVLPPLSLIHKPVYPELGIHTMFIVDNKFQRKI